MKPVEVVLSKKSQKRPKLNLLKPKDENKLNHIIVAMVNPQAIQRENIRIRNQKDGSFRFYNRSKQRMTDIGRLVRTNLKWNSDDHPVNMELIVADGKPQESRLDLVAKVALDGYKRGKVMRDDRYICQLEVRFLNTKRKKRQEFLHRLAVDTWARMQINHIMESVSIYPPFIHKLATRPMGVQVGTILY